jgi:hypothetical protein
MRLLELFDNPVVSQRTSSPPISRNRKSEYRFTIDGIEYLTIITVKDIEQVSKEFDVPQEVLNAGGRSMSIDFSIQAMHGGYEWKAFERIGKGTQFKAFATVIHHAQSELNAHPNIRSIHIGTMSEDTARKNLYLRMLRRYFPQAKVIEVPNQPAEGTDYLQTRIFAIL